MEVFINEKKFLFIIYILLFSYIISCMTSARNLTRINLGMSKTDVIKVLGEPESVSLSFMSKDDKRIDVWDYRLYQYEMATSLSPYYDIYSLIFVNDKLFKYQKTVKGSRLSEKAALKILGY